MSQNRMIRRMFKVAARATLPVFLVATCAALPATAAVDVSVDETTGYRVLTVAAGEFAEYATVLDASVPGLIKRGAGTAWLTGANSAFVGSIIIEAGSLGANSGGFGKNGNLSVLSNASSWNGTQILLR